MASPRRFQRYLIAFFFALLVIIALTSRYDLQPDGQSSPNTQPGTAADAQQKQPVSNAPLTQWGALPRKYPIESFREPPPSVPLDIPRIQYNFRREAPSDQNKRLERLKAVKEAFIHSWQGYKKYAWMKDEVRPISGGNTDAFGGWAATLVDSLDTLWIMGLHDEFDEAVVAVDKIDFTSCALEILNVFETTIRYMGGFLAAYDLSGRPVLLNKAKELGELIYKSFDTPNHMPITRWNWSEALGGAAQEAASVTVVAEIGSLSLELTRLSQLTGDPRYFDAIARVTDVFRDQQDNTVLPGMWPIMVNSKAISFSSGRDFTLGGMADSVFEYLPKEYLLLGGHDNDYRTMYEKAITAAKKDLFFRPMLPGDPDILISGSVSATSSTLRMQNEGQHLTCFVGGMMAIAAKVFGLDDMDTASKITNGCVWAYGATKTGIMPELFRTLPCENEASCTFNETLWSEQHVDEKLPKGIISSSDREYKLRPEAIESLWVLYRVTGDPAWMDKGWTMFENVEKATRTPIAYATLEDVFGTAKVVDGPQKDKMESFWTAETLKYYYLLFSEPGVISLDEYVLNTEAHPLKRPVKKGPWW